MILKTLCLLIMFLLSTNLTYSQTSVCNMDANEFCFGVGYLSEETVRLSEKLKTKPLYKNNDFSFGFGYGLSDTLKFTLLPSFEMDRSENSFSLGNPYIGFQLLKTAYDTSFEELEEINYINYFVVGTTHTAILDNLTTEAIIGLGTYYKHHIWGLKCILFSNVYGKLQMKNLRYIFDDNPYIISEETYYSYQDNLGIEFGSEIKFPKEYTFSAKFDISSKSPQISLTISLIRNKL